MKSNNGFTLIELVMVIAIIGILSVFVVPTYINIQSSARMAVLEELSNTFKSASNLVYAKAIINGKDSVASTESPEVEGISIHYGYPDVTADQSGIYNAVRGLENENLFTFNTNNNSILFVTFSNLVTEGVINRVTIESTGCYVAYTEASDSVAFNVELNTTLCQ